MEEFKISLMRKLTRKLLNAYEAKCYYELLISYHEEQGHKKSVAEIKLLLSSSNKAYRQALNSLKLATKAMNKYSSLDKLVNPIKTYAYSKAKEHYENELFGQATPLYT